MVQIPSAMQPLTLRKFGNILLLIALLGIFISMAMAMFHSSHRTIRSIMAVSLIIVICGYAALAITPYGNPNAYNKAVYKRIRTVRFLLNAGLSILLAGMLFRIYRVPVGRCLIITGVLVEIVSFAGLYYHRYMNKKRPLLNIPVIAVDPSKLQAFTGNYYCQHLKMHIRVFMNDAGNGLNAQANGQDPFSLNPIGKNIFNYDRAGIVMEFKPEQYEFIFVQGGGYFTFFKQ